MAEKGTTQPGKEDTVEVRLQLTVEAREALRAMSPTTRKQGQFLTDLLLASYKRFKELQAEAAADPVDAVLASAGKAPTRKQ